MKPINSEDNKAESAPALQFKGDKENRSKNLVVHENLLNHHQENQTVMVPLNSDDNKSPSGQIRELAGDEANGSLGLVVQENVPNPQRENQTVVEPICSDENNASAPASDSTRDEANGSQSLTVQVNAQSTHQVNQIVFPTGCPKRTNNGLQYLDKTIRWLKFGLKKQDKLDYLCSKLENLAVNGREEDCIRLTMRDVTRITAAHLKDRVQVLTSRIEDKYSKKTLKKMSKFERDRILFRREFNQPLGLIKKCAMQFVYQRISNLKKVPGGNLLICGYRTLLKHYHEILGPDFLFLQVHDDSDDFRDFEFFTLCGILQVSAPTLKFH